MMILTGVFVNALGVCLAGLAGSLFRRGLPERVRTTLNAGLALCVLAIGIGGVAKETQVVVAILSLVLGVLVGEAADLDRRLTALGSWLQRTLTSGGEDTRFAEGFVSATVFVCVGAMSVVGALESGMQGRHDTFFAKAVIDSAFVFVMATSLGTGCALSGLVALVYQAALTLAASLLAQFLTPDVIAEMSSVGSILILAIGLNLLRLTHVKIANLLPATFFPIALCPLAALLS